jgi:hypothetical protein
MVFFRDIRAEGVSLERERGLLYLCALWSREAFKFHDIPRLRSPSC